MTKAAETVTTTDTDTSQPLWKEQYGRVQGAIWKHDQEKGKTRYTVAISRSYKDQETDKWVSVHYFDSRDLRDVRRMAEDAEAQCDRLKQS